MLKTEIRTETKEIAYCRNGLEVEILARNAALEDGKQIIGILIGHDGERSVESWDNDGTYFESESGLDLVFE